jgi:hypothetical protein
MDLTVSMTSAFENIIGDTNKLVKSSLKNIVLKSKYG